MEKLGQYNYIACGEDEAVASNNIGLRAHLSSGAREAAGRVFIENWSIADILDRAERRRINKSQD